MIDAGIELAPTDLAPYHDAYTLALQGWALDRAGRPMTIHVRDRSALVYRTRADLPSPGIAARHPGMAAAERCGFQLVLGTMSLPKRFKLGIIALTEDRTRTLLGHVEGRRRALPAARRGGLQPLIVTTMGRTGSNWVMALFSQHPEIIAYRPFQTEPRVAGYWMEVLRTLADPASYMQSVFAQRYGERWWIGDDRPGPLPLRVDEPTMPRWLGSENAQALAHFCSERIDRFYEKVALLEKRDGLQYFAEKAFPGPTGGMIRELYPGAREVVLIRDLRDVVCSILDYSARRGLTLWGGRTSSDPEWFGYLRTQALRMLESWKDGAELLRYEQAIADPAATLTDLFRALGLDTAPATVRQVIDGANKLLPKAQLMHQTSGSVAGSVGRWKHDLSSERMALSAQMLDRVLAEFGYEPTKPS